MAQPWLHLMTRDPLYWYCTVPIFEMVPNDTFSEVVRALDPLKKTRVAKRAGEQTPAGSSGR